MILGTVTTNSCEGLLLASLLPNGSWQVLVPVNWIVVAEEMKVVGSFHIASDLLARQVSVGRKAA